MRIVVISDWFAEKMGYAENLLPEALARQGAEVHVVTSDLQPDFPNYRETYEPFLGPRKQAVGRKELNGFVLHRLPHGSELQGISLRGLGKVLREIRPDIVQTFVIPSFSTYQAVFWKPTLGYRLFLEEHMHRSVFRPGLKGRMFFSIFRWTAGKIIGAASEQCFPIAPDVAEIATHVYGYPAGKITLCPLGVDTDLFHPVGTETDRSSRAAARQRLGFLDDDIVCVYSGRFHPDKDPRCLSVAVEMLHRKDKRFKSLIIGSGTQAEVEEIGGREGCVVHPFVPARQLPDLYRACEIGVWPRQESTSQLDAAACGLPIIISDNVQASERIDGNGLTYREGDANSLADRIASLADAAIRRRMGEAGARRMRDLFSWDAIAKQRLNEYQR